LDNKAYNCSDSITARQNKRSYHKDPVPRPAWTPQE